MNTKKNKVLTYLLWLLIVAIAGYALYGLSGAKIYIESPWKNAYADCQTAVTQRGRELEQAVLARSSRIPELAERLTGWSAKWVVVKSLGDKEKINAWVTEQVEPVLYNSKENQLLVARCMAAAVSDWKEIENNLAMELGRPVIGQEPKGLSVGVTDIPIPEGMDAELWKQIMYDLAANVGGEVAAVMATEMALSMGIITASASTSWATGGISLVVGILTTWVVELITDPKPELEKKLKAQLKKNAAEMRAMYEKSVLDILRNRALNWE